MNRRKLIIAAIIGIGLLIFLFAGNGIYKTLILKSRVAELEDQIDSLRLVNDRMKRKLEGFKKGDPLTLEEEARSHGLIKPGEKVYLLEPKGKK